MDGLINACGLLTIIPVKKAKLDAKAPFYFYPIGFIVGFLVALIIYFSSKIATSLIAGCLGVLADIIITGAIHFDGLVDSADALIGSKDKESARKIIKDPHVGSFALAFGASALLIRFSIFSSIEQIHTSVVGIALIYGSTRALAAIVLSIMPIAKSSYMANMIMAKNLKIPILVLNSLFYLASVFVLFLIFPRSYLLLRAIFLLALPAIFALLLLSRAKSLLNGITGDVLGAFIYGSELLMLGSLTPLH